MPVKIGNRRRRHSSLLHREGGQAALEFVLVLPIFVVFFFLVFDFGFMMYQYVSVSNAVREGTRYGAVNCRPTSATGTCTQTLVRDLTIKRSGGILAPTTASTVDCTVWTGWAPAPPPPNKNQEVCVAWTGTNRGDSVLVKVDHFYQFLFVPGMSVHAVSCADMSLEQKDNGTGLLIDSGNRC